MPSRIVILQRIIPEYRIPFYIALKKWSESVGIDLIICHGQEFPGCVPKSAGSQLPFESIYIKNTYLFGGRLVVQRFPRLIYSADLIIVEQANRLTANYVLLVKKLFGCDRFRVAYWAHGINWQSRSGSLRERVKKRLRKYVDYWFCYTEQVRLILRDVPEYRKCNVNNAIDTLSLATAVEKSAARGAKERGHLLFIGSMRDDKRLDWIFRALLEVRTVVPDVTVSFVGDGPLRGQVEQFCTLNAWSSCVGPIFGNAVADYIWRASAILMPGLVGLVVLDSFVGQAPILTTPFNSMHSPEYAYLNPGENSLVSSDNESDYAQMIIRYLQDGELQQRLQQGCLESSFTFTIENMVERFKTGIREALTVPRCFESK